jgi:hypothetical protein
MKLTTDCTDVHGFSQLQASPWESVKSGVSIFFLNVSIMVAK